MGCCCRDVEINLGMADTPLLRASMVEIFIGASSVRAACTSLNLLPNPLPFPSFSLPRVLFLFLPSGSCIQLSNWCLFPDLRQAVARAGR